MKFVQNEYGVAGPTEFTVNRTLEIIVIDLIEIGSSNRLLLIINRTFGTSWKPNGVKLPTHKIG